MRKIRNTDTMLFALYKAWKKRYGIYDSEGAEAALAVEAQTWKSFTGDLHVTFFNGGCLSVLFLSDLPSGALEAFDKVQNKAEWTRYAKTLELKGPWSAEHEAAFDFIVSFWRERI